MKTPFKITLLLLALLLAITLYFAWDLATFPGRIAEPEYTAAKADGKWTFREGTVYRHEGHPPMLEASGNHYETGLQYGVLLRPEILAGLEAYEGVLRYTVEDAIAFLRSRQGPDGRDYSWLGSHSSIANDWGQQIIVFAPDGEGFYMALGATCCPARSVPVR